MDITGYIPILITIIGVLVALVNIIVEVVKKATWDKIPTSLLAIIVSIVLTLVAFFAWAALNDIAIVWYYVAAAVIIGFLVAYASMFGFDKLKEILISLKTTVTETTDTISKTTDNINT